MHQRLQILQIKGRGMGKREEEEGDFTLDNVKQHHLRREKCREKGVCRWEQLLLLSWNVKS